MGGWFLNPIIYIWNCSLLQSPMAGTLPTSMPPPVAAAPPSPQPLAQISQTQSVPAQLTQDQIQQVSPQWRWRYSGPLLTHCPLADVEITLQVYFSNSFYEMLFCEIGTCIWWMPQNPIDGKSAWVQVMAWCHQASSHFLNQCWPRFMSSYGGTQDLI